MGKHISLCLHLLFENPKAGREKHIFVSAHFCTFSAAARLLSQRNAHQRKLLLSSVVRRLRQGQASALTCPPSPHTHTSPASILLSLLQREGIGTATCPCPPLPSMRQVPLCRRSRPLLPPPPRLWSVGKGHRKRTVHTHFAGEAMVWRDFARILPSHLK